MTIPELNLLPPPDPDAPERIWRRVRHTRSERRPPLWWAVPVGAALATAAVAVAVWPEQPTEQALVAASAPAELTWSDQVQLTFTGQGRATGTSRDVTIAWESGTVRASVVPSSGTRLRIETDEAVVEVVGTVFSVTRSRLGATAEVEHGTVRVSCRDGWSGLVTAATGPHTCLPVTPAGLLGRADAQRDDGADAAAVLATVDRGIAAAAAGTAVHGELLARRMELHADVGDADAALADARAYLAAGHPGRAVEAHRLAGWLLLAAEGCDAARPHLEAALPGGAPEDAILLAECSAAADPTAALELLRGLPDPLEPAWAERASALRRALTEVPR